MYPNKFLQIDFFISAMENWGLVTFREVTMLHDEKVSAPLNKQRVATVNHTFFQHNLTQHKVDQHKVDQKSFAQSLYSQNNHYFVYFSPLCRLSPMNWYTSGSAILVGFIISIHITFEANISNFFSR